MSSVWYRACVREGHRMGLVTTMALRKKVRFRNTRSLSPGQSGSVRYAPRRDRVSGRAYRFAHRSASGTKGYCIAAAGRFVRGSPRVVDSEYDHQWSRDRPRAATAPSGSFGMTRSLSPAGNSLSAHCRPRLGREDAWSHQGTRRTSAALSNHWFLGVTSAQRIREDRLSW
jgi:hypothetical protein